MESEGLDAVRLMTIHRAKGLEFPVVCVADLGRGPTFRHELIRLSRDGERLGLLVGRPGTGGKLRSLDYEELAEERWAAEQAEERRLFYVAMTRARERLILSGAMRESGGSSTPADWIVPAFRDLPGVRYTWLSDDFRGRPPHSRPQDRHARVVAPGSGLDSRRAPGHFGAGPPAPKSPVAHVPDPQLLRDRRARPLRLPLLRREGSRSSRRPPSRLRRQPAAASGARRSTGCCSVSTSGVR